MTELVWDGKYDNDGRRVAPLKVVLPFQTVETVNESAQERQRSFDLFSGGKESEWRNRLIWGDKKYVLPSLLGELQGQVDLIYIDPPFATGQDFSFSVNPNGSDFTKEPSMIEIKAYRDTWGVTPSEAARGVMPLDKYLAWFHHAVAHAHELLSESGSLWVHVDFRVGFYVKCVLDEVFGPDGFRNDVVWCYGGSGRGAKAIAGQFPRNHDMLLWYSKNLRPFYSPQYIRKTYTVAEAINAGFRQDETGRWFKTSPRGDYTDKSIAKLDAEGRIHRTRTGGIRIKYFLDQHKGNVVDDVLLGDTWLDIADAMHIPDAEKTGYSTQKPQALLERIINATCPEGGLVLDFVVGSGTTAAAAETLGRRWVVADLGRFAIHTTRKRLLSIPKIRPFVVQNLGKYERQVWQVAEFGESATARTMAYRSFIVNLYDATPISGYSWLHGLKNGRMVHVGTVDAPVSSGDVKQIVAEFRRAIGAGKQAPSTKGVDLLGWDFAFELNEIAHQDAEKAGIDLRLVRIPREVLDKRAVEQGDVQFFELAALSLGLEQSGRQVTLSIDDFVIPVDDVPADVQATVVHWAQWIDYWAIDWDNKDDTFHNEWQAYRTRKCRDLILVTNHEYPGPGEYTVVVKVIDILGNDTTKTMLVKVADRGA
jgi:DNA modification methylase